MENYQIPDENKILGRKDKELKEANVKFIAS
jgi:hypothetical protein